MPPQTPDGKNTIAFVAIAMAVLLGYQMLVVEPAAQKRKAELAKVQPAAAQALPTPSLAQAPLSPSSVSQAASAITPPKAAPRLAIEAPGIEGSINLAGVVIDDVRLRGYRETLDADAPLVTLLQPQGGGKGYYASTGWSGGGAPAADAVWTQITPGTLSPTNPVTVQYVGAGVRIDRVLAVDEAAMLTITDTVHNTGAQALSWAPYGLVRRHNPPKTPASVAHEGFIGWVGDRLEDRKFKKIADKGPFQAEGNGGWYGITDVYWMTTLIPSQSAALKTEYRSDLMGDDRVFTASHLGGVRTIAAGATSTEVTRIFAGAKRVRLIESYASRLNITRFDAAIDWGMFWFFTKPFFLALDFFAGLAGSWGITAQFGVAILMLTVVVKLVFFPLANASYAAMTKMKKVQPQVDLLRARHKGDLQKLNVEMMELYKREKINPLAGCLPMLIQIPVFFALYKVLVINLEMRHAPFYGWVNDLSAPDPTTMFNLFGLLPFDPTGWPLIGAFLTIGAWPIIMGLTMWAQMAMNPPAQDPIQRQVFAFMPIIFTLMLAHFAAGLVIYWAWSNLLSILQQYAMMRRYQVDTPFDALLARLFGRKGAANDG